VMRRLKPYPRNASAWNGNPRLLIKKCEY